MKHLKIFHHVYHNKLFLFSCRFMQKWLEMSWLMPGQLENIIIVCIMGLRFSQIAIFFLSTVKSHTFMGCNHLFQYPLLLTHPSVVSCTCSCKLITINHVHVCSCAAYGACSFTHYTRVCSTNSSKRYYHWRGGIFINLFVTLKWLCSLV